VKYNFIMFTLLNRKPTAQMTTVQAKSGRVLVDSKDILSPKEIKRIHRRTLFNR